MDRIDRRILDCLQRDAGLSTAEIADRVGLSTTPCWRRIQNLEKAGILKGRVALLDRDQLNLGVDVFVSLRISRHGEEWLKTFTEAVDEFPEVVEFYRMSGDVDYLMRVVVADIKAYDAFYKRLIRHTGIADVSSSFAMERIKYTTALPLDKI
ncbi:MAG: Lrp/AsnC family transcriptional regulator [Gammaproteobacteria bacterium]|nr:Lrp/AsnC family transcriptional regulator [Gammaproteobacteria bacterium]MDX2460053.1 Lrp/AsnC family transcriptional regulator [Gammaproteobacteria bacterium]